VPPRRSPSRGCNKAHRTRLNPVSHTTTATTAKARHFCPPASQQGLLEPDARRRARPALRGRTSQGVGLPGARIRAARRAPGFCIPFGGVLEWRSLFSGLRHSGGNHAREIAAEALQGRLDEPQQRVRLAARRGVRRVCADHHLPRERTPPIPMEERRSGETTNEWLRFGATVRQRSRIAGLYGCLFRP